MRHSKFDLGCVVATARISDRMESDKAFSDFVQDSLNRHMDGDWGDLCISDLKLNNDALCNGLRILSAYESKKLKTKIWIITEADRSYTTILYPEEY